MMSRFQVLLLYFNLRRYTEDATLHLVLRAAPGGRADTRRAPPDRPPLPLADASCRDQVGRCRLN